MQDNNKITTEDFYIVGIGASAGGLEALQLFLKFLPTNLNCAYIITQHLSPTHKSMMVPLLARETRLKVVDVENDLLIQKNYIYVTPPDKDIFVTKDNKIHMQAAHDGLVPKPSVDMFFESLAKAKQDYAVGIIMSGTGSDGSKGIAAIKAAGGLTIVQEPSEAKYDGMPRSAINTGHVDVIISMQDFAKEFEELIKLPKLCILNQDENLNNSLKEQIFALLAKEKNIDFSMYKQSTVNRRIERRMVALKITKLFDYVEVLKNNKEEVVNLYKDMLIGVTSFFRDSEAFDSITRYLKFKIESKPKTEPIRIWVAGCSTGEEAYSIAIVLADILGSDIGFYKVQIFATDIDEDATAFARRGIYSESSVANIKKHYIKKYFTKKHDSYEIIKPIRDLIIFSTHDIIKDPPFLRVDLLMCRNVLIYFNQSLQQKAMASFHHALDVNGILFLGKSESILTREDWFVAVDKHAKIFKSLYSGREGRLYSIYTNDNEISRKKPIIKSKDIKDSAKDIISESIFPYYVVLNENFDILYFRGEDNPYFTIGRQGDATLNFFKLINQDLSIAARAVLNEAKKQKCKTWSKIIILDLNGTKKYVQLMSVPFTHDDSGNYYLFAFVEFTTSDFEYFIPLKSDNSSNIEYNKELENEVVNMREYLQTVIEELETSNEELQGANEELQSSNEELQSSNEELQTTNEELQSTNEELQIAYTELRLIYDENEQQKLLIEEKTQELEIANSKLEKLNKQLEDMVASEIKARMEKELIISVIFEKVKMAICMTNDNGNIIQANNFMCELVGYDKKELVGVDIFNLVAEQYVNKTKDLFKKIIDGEFFKPEEELYIKTKDDKELVMLATFSVLDKHKKDSNIIISMLDRTQMKKLEEERQIQESHIIEQARSAQMGEMIGMIGHQWRQPLNIINLVSGEWFLSTQEGEINETDAMEHYQNILKQTSYMSKTIDDFRNFFKKGEEKPFSVAAALDNAISLANTQLKTYFIALQTDINDSIVNGNENQFVQVILTLISNSKDSILERLKLDNEKGVIAIKTQVLDNQIKIKVLDNGKGAQQKVIGKMFDPYFTTKHASAGTGLGLHMAQVIICKHMGGDIVGKNRADMQGFDMTITLPIYKA